MKEVFFDTIAPLLFEFLACAQLKSKGGKYVVGPITTIVLSLSYSISHPGIVVLVLLVVVVDVSTSIFLSGWLAVVSFWVLQLVIVVKIITVTTE